QHLYSSFNHLTHVNSKQHLRFSSQGEQNFVSISPFGDQYELDWLIVVAIPESDFMGQIMVNTRNTTFWWLRTTR
ncbi:MAG: histidine kinase, partial [Pseudanabaenales cyanobacterium]|nr:histidine kinase [Pseudanabaenales cyanobacterium]